VPSTNPSGPTRTRARGRAAKLRRALREILLSLARESQRIDPVHEAADDLSKSEGLGRLFSALGGTAAVPRMFDRHPTTVSRWRTGDRPLPAEVPRDLRERAGLHPRPVCRCGLRT
jgi:hypothetical protein